MPAREKQLQFWNGTFTMYVVLYPNWASCSLMQLCRLLSRSWMEFAQWDQKHVKVVLKLIYLNNSLWFFYNNQRKWNTISWNWRRIRKNLNATSKMIWFYFELVGGVVLIGFGSNNHYCMHVCMFYVHTKLKQKQLHVKLRSSCLQRTDVTIELAPIRARKENKNWATLPILSKQSFLRQKLRNFYFYTMYILLHICV